MPQVTIPRDFFIKERRTLYSHFPFAFWRELVQNSVDAGARTIDIAVSEIAHNDGTTLRVTCRDDGCGMDRDTLTNVFFSLGATTKGEDGDIGGFGRARLLLCFSMERYAIRTRSFLVTGEGGSYEIEEGLSFERGTTFTIDVPGSETSASSLRAALLDIASLSRIRARIRLDGVELDEGISNGRFVRTISCREHGDFADIHVARSGEHLSRVIVRAGGVVMFTRRLSAEVRVVVSLHPEKARAVLTASRDGMHYEAQSELDAFCDRMSVDSRSALKPRRTDRSAHFSFGGMMLASRKTDMPRVESMSSSAQTASCEPQASAAVLDGQAPRPARGAVHQTPPRAAPSIGDIFIIDECDTPLMRRAMPRFDPTNWEVERIVSSGKGKGRNAYLLMKAWTLACEAAMEALVEEMSLDEVVWTRGWYFGTAGEDMALAVHKAIGTGHVLALCPIDERGRQAYSTSHRADLLRLIALARHEAAHVRFRWHSEEFARLLTAIDARMDDGRLLARIISRLR